MKIFVYIGLIFSFFTPPSTKTKVTFNSFDSLEITADLYLANDEYPYILLFHQQGSSRGEYNETAEKLTKLGFNCLAVDLRMGDNSNFVSNETARRIRDLQKPTRLIDSRLDIIAAIDYAYNLNKKQVILLGSSFSGSLCLLEGKNNPNVKAVIAFSPGEYFGDDLNVEQALDTFSIPLFVTGTEFEYPYLEQMLHQVPGNLLTLYKPSGTLGVQGSRALWEDSESKDQYWLALLLFINSIK